MFGDTGWYRCTSCTRWLYNGGKGKIIAEDVKVELHSQWPDYVFSAHFQLRPLEETEQFIRHNKHFPGIPPAEEARKNGIDLGSMNGLLLQKIEELTLSVIDLKKENDRMKAEIEVLKKNQKKRQHIEVIF